MYRYLVIILLFSPMGLLAQVSTLEGSIKDTTSSKNLQNAVVSLLQQEDSILVDYTRADVDGHFNFPEVKPGDYILLITYPKYAAFVEKFSLAADVHKKFDGLILTPRAVLLENIIIGQSPIRIKGDTTIFFADSFKVKPNATVEDLLKQLPGVQVDRYGKITAQGETVQRVLVDGEEFFSDDPTVATKNLRADAVKEVQVFDKKSEQAEFTGIDDGQEQKTINLKLKEGAKKGYFGRLAAGGLEDYYLGEALINAFKGKRKWAAFAKTSNTSATGLDASSSRNYGFSGSRNVNVDGGVVYIGGSSLTEGEIGAGGFGGQGLPESIKGGIHFSNKWDDDKYETSLNYLFNNLGTQNRSDVFTQYTLEDSVYFDNQHSEGTTERTQHSFSGEFEWQIDSLSSLELDTKVFGGIGDYSNDYFTQSLDQKGEMINESSRSTGTSTEQLYENINLTYKKKFSTKGRTFSLNLDHTYNENNSTGYLYNEATFFNGMMPIRDTTDQKKINSSTNQVLGIRGTYTEPLSSKSFLVLNYSFYNNNSLQDRNTFDKNMGGKYDQMVDSLSNEFKYVYNTHSAGANFRFNEKKYNFSIGGNVANTAFKQSDLIKDTMRKRSYTNFYPRADFNYSFSNYSRLGLSYSGASTQPTIEQIQPLPNNQDPLNIVVGNPSLKQQFTHNLRLQYNNFQIVQEQYIFAGIFASFTDDNITSSYVIDAQGRKTSRYINLDGYYNVRVFGVYNKKIKNSTWRLGGGPIVSISRYVNMVNNVLNKNLTTTRGARITANSRKPETYTFDFQFRPEYNTSKSSISTAAASNYWTYNFQVSGDVTLPWKLELGTDWVIDLRQQQQLFDQNNNTFLWNAYLEKKFLKNDALTLRASVHDILDDNKGYYRDFGATSIEESRYLTFRRYGLVTLTYNFVNKGGKSPENSGGIRL